MLRFIHVVVVALALVGCQSKKAEKPSAEPVKIEGRRIDIKVSNAGYDPNSVNVKANEQVTLVFTLTEKSECAEEVEVPSLGVKKKLPVGEPVSISLRPEQPGELKFTCGMHMFEGSILVTQN